MPVLAKKLHPFDWFAVPARSERSNSTASHQFVAARLAALLGVHELRHIWATIAARSGTPIDRLMHAGGWTSYAMPLRYIEAGKIANEGVKLG